MILGILKEIKQDEKRVSVTPAGVETITENGHEVLVEKGAGIGSGFLDEAYEKAGAKLVNSANRIYDQADMIIHVKEPQPSEYGLIKEGQIILAYLHLAASKELTHALINSGSVNIAYESIQKSDGSLPLLIPMSEVAGRMAIQQGAKYLETEHGGAGILLGGVPGVNPGNVLILGGGTVGTNSAKMACGLGAKVYLLETNLNRLRYLDDIMPKNCFSIMPNAEILREFVRIADVIVGAVLIPGARAPVLIGCEMLKEMKKGAVLVDVAIDQGGCFETSRATTHTEPVYIVDDVVHYCVSNMPGAVPRTSTLALTNASLPYIVELANKGWKRSMIENPEIKLGANVVCGNVSCKGVADSLGLDHYPIDSLLQ